MKAAHLADKHYGKTLITGTGSKRKRSKLLSVEYFSSYVIADIMATHGKERAVLPNETEIEIEE
ncbi:hypothetical protein ACFRAQ_34675 [Nocardia sp. NPDC056611]|uniref:hypothetical protein n=1 Tax=Nocardia sp. NPDC056611 TaxID=3345877 RepID=UPI003671C373